jgi:hypothetical protein
LSDPILSRVESALLAAFFTTPLFAIGVLVLIVTG